jgi:osmotically-inducible protein OsmY|tara:strand:+ start:97 stop:291 length:195 start_codon:yes stop_codon:yes gene_type:complete
MPGLKSEHVSVVVVDGVATVWGMVVSDADRLAIGVAAEREPSVIWVENNINVMPTMICASMGAQ